MDKLDNANYEQKIGKTLFKVTNEYIGKQDFSRLLEDLIVQKILRQKENDENA